MNLKEAGPTILTIFGGSGDLTNRKLIPALFNLFLDNWLPEKFAVIGLSRTRLSDEEYRGELEKGVDEFSRRGKPEKAAWEKFSKMLYYQQADILKEESYGDTSERINTIEGEWGSQAILIFYLAIGPGLIETVANNLGRSGICRNIHRSRIVVEKPFGHDLQSAKALNKLLTGMFDEKQIYRIDHYLGKETVQNLLVFRFANALFEPIWNLNFIEHVQITASEEVGVGSRGGYYDTSGALKDMIQNHVLQLLCVIAMEPPVSFNADEIRNKKVDVLHALRKFNEDNIFKDAVRGQYGPGEIKGEKVTGYRKEPKIKPDSHTETFAALKFYIDNWRWQNVPFYVRTGKRLSEKTTVINIRFRPVPHRIFPSQATENWHSNQLIINIQPAMGIQIQFQAKRPGQEMLLTPVDMLFNYGKTSTSNLPTAYETLLHDVMIGDATLFMRSDEVEAAWKILMPVIETWEKAPFKAPNYPAGSWGPEDSEELIERDGHHWSTMPDGDSSYAKQAGTVVVQKDVK